MARGKGLPQAPDGTLTRHQSGSKNGKLDQDSRVQPHPPRKTVTTSTPRCPECASQKLWKDGLRYTRHGEVQRWLCRNCGYRFSEPSQNDYSSKVKHSEHNQNIQTLILKTPDSYILDRRVSDRRQSGAKNLARVEPQKSRLEARQATKEHIKGLLATFIAKSELKGLKTRTIENRLGFLNLLLKRGANLLDPESVFRTIDSLKMSNHKTREILEEEWSDGSKNNAAQAYKSFCKLNKIAIPEDINFDKWRPTPKLPWVPLEREIDALIAGCSRKIAAFLQTIKETGIRCGEAYRLKWIDIDHERNTIMVNRPEKHGLPRQFKISGKLVAMLNALPKKSQQIFGDSLLASLRKNFMQQRKRIAFKLQNPRLNRITFHTLRHWKGTMEYHKTKSILHVKELLGHRNISSTMIYTHLVNFESDEFHVAHAKNLQEEDELVKAGFEFIRFSKRDDVAIYRKRK